MKNEDMLTKLIEENEALIDLEDAKAAICKNMGLDESDFEVVIAVKAIER